jgi:hypothetical protein
MLRLRNNYLQALVIASLTSVVADAARYRSILRSSAKVLTRWVRSACTIFLSLAICPSQNNATILTSAVDPGSDIGSSRCRLGHCVEGMVEGK